MKLFNEESIDWAEAARHGISRRMLSECGYLDILLEGGSTPDIPLRLTFGNTVIFTDASLTLKMDDFGVVGFEILGVGWH